MYSAGMRMVSARVMRLYMLFFLRRDSLRGLSEEGEIFSRPSSAMPLEESSVRPGDPPALYKHNG
jgi:hypothetical protein